MKSMFTLLVLTFSLSSFAAPAVCTYEYDANGTTLSWTAFKTPKKAPVKIKFTKFKITATKMPTLEQMFASATFEVNSQSVDSGDKARDAKIMQFFFKKMMGGNNIKGKVLKAEADKLEVEMTMNKVTKTVPMSMKFDETTSMATLTGKVDVLEFALKDNLAALTKACMEKHEGVTWPDVELELVAKIKKSCK